MFKQKKIGVFSYITTQGYPKELTKWDAENKIELQSLLQESFCKQSLRLKTVINICR